MTVEVRNPPKKWIKHVKRNYVIKNVLIVLFIVMLLKALSSAKIT
jgi:hypothetical protein